MKKVGLFGGINLSAKNLVILVAAAIAGYFVVKKILDKKKDK